MPAPRCTLFVPQLLWPEPADADAFGQLSLPGLERLLARASFTRLPQKPWEEALALCFGLDAGAPFGDFRLAGEAERPPSAAGHWVCADPVHLKFHQERIVLSDTAGFPLSLAEARQLVDALNAEFGDIGTFHAAHPQRWYLRLHAPAAYDTAPLSAVAGRTLAGALPKSPASAPLRRWLNEIQMFLHGHPVNVARAETGLPAVNGVWVWGAVDPAKSPLPQFADFAPHFSAVLGAEPLAEGIAHAAGVPAHPKPASLAKLLDRATASGHYFIVLDDLLAPALYEDAAAWREALNALEQAWFRPLAFHSTSLAVTLMAPTIYGLLRWERHGLDPWKFWRRPRTLGELAQGLAT